MSANNDTQTGESTMTISADAATRVQRSALARQHSEDVPAAIPDETEVEGDEAWFDNLFNEDGMAFDSWWEWKSFDDDPLWEDDYRPGEKRRALLKDPREETAAVSPDDDPEAFLEAVAPERLERINEQFGDLPGTREDLIEVQARKVVQEAEERGEDLHVSGGLTITKKQTSAGKRSVAERLKELEEGEDETLGGETFEECPVCGTEDVTGSTVEKQTRAADESGTQFTKFSCGCTARRTD